MSDYTTEPNSWEELIRASESQYGEALVGAIYRVYCQETNISYVGQTTDLYLIGKHLKPTRIKTHYAALKKGCHPCKELQAVWDATNGESFTDECLEIVTLQRQPSHNYYRRREKLTDREKFWQEKHSAKTGRSLPENRHYPLKTEELKLLKASGIINNATLIYFVLKLKNPWCDRPVKVYPLEIAAEWGIPESSVYEAILKLKDSEIVEISKAEMIVQWHSQQADHSGNPESFQDSRMDSGKSESILENQNEFQDSRMDSGKSEKRSPEHIQEGDSRSPHTIQTLKTNQTLSDSRRPTKKREKDYDFFDQKEPIEDCSKMQKEGSAAPPSGIDEICKSRGFHPWADPATGKTRNEFALFVGEMLPRSSMPPLVKGRNHIRTNNQSDEGLAKNQDYWEVFQEDIDKPKPWLLNGTLDADFVRDRAELWQKGNPQGNAFMSKHANWAIEDVMSEVVKHYADCPEELATDWAAYYLKNERYVGNLKTRLQSGVEIPALEQAKALPKINAVARGFTDSGYSLPSSDTTLKLEPCVVALPCSEEMPELIEINQAIALIRSPWQTLKLNWQDQRFLHWLEQAQTIEQFDTADLRLGFHSLPEWVVCKLAQDLVQIALVKEENT